MAAVAFGDMIIHCSNPNASDESAAFAKRLATGLKGNEFHGLVGLLSYGDNSSDAEALTAKVASWAEQLLSGTVDAGDWLEAGLNIVAQTAKERISNFELDIRRHFDSLLNAEAMALTGKQSTPSSIYNALETLEQLESNRSRAANGLGCTSEHLGSLIAVMGKVLPILKAFGSLDPSAMIRGWIENTETYIYGISDVALIAAAGAAAASADPGARTSRIMRLSKGDVGYGVSSLLGSIMSFADDAAFAGEKEVEAYLQKKAESVDVEDAAESAVEATAQTMVAEKKGSLRGTLLHMALSAETEEEKNELCEAAKDQMRSERESVLTVLHTSLLLLKRGKNVSDDLRRCKGQAFVYARASGNDARLF